MMRPSAWDLVTLFSTVTGEMPTVKETGTLNETRLTTVAAAGCEPSSLPELG